MINYEVRVFENGRSTILGSFPTLAEAEVLLAEAKTLEMDAPLIRPVQACSVNGATSSTSEKSMPAEEKVIGIKSASKILTEAVRLRRAFRAEGITEDLKTELKKDSNLTVGSVVLKEGVSMDVAHSLASKVAKAVEAHVETHNMWGEWL